MPIAMRKLTDLVGKDILVVQLDGRSFKGRLMEIDSVGIYITQALEFSQADSKWKIPMVAVPPESSVEGEVVKHDKLEKIKLREIILAFSGIMRIYQVTTKLKTMEKPIVEKTPAPFIPPVSKPPKTTGEYVIRSVYDEEEDKKKW